MSPAAAQRARLVVHDGENPRTVAISQIPFTIGPPGDRSLSCLAAPFLLGRADRSAIETTSAT